MTFEDKLFRQQAYWVGGLTVDMLTLEVRLSLIANPDLCEIDGIVTFEGCKQFTGGFHDSEVYDPNYIPSLLGIIDTLEGQQTRYIITTDTVEVSFTTPVEPRVQWKDPNKPKKTWNREQLQVQKRSLADSPVPHEVKEMTSEQIRYHGLEALKRELGVVGMVQFSQQFSNGKGDYSTERHALLDTLTQKDILAQISELQKGMNE